MKLKENLPLFCLDIANNHMGSKEHANRIIREIYHLAKNYPFKTAIKFQFRDLDTFIHPKHKNDFSYKYIKRFTETRLSWEDYYQLVREVRSLRLITEVTPFDEESVDQLVKMGVDIIKVASCSFTDWPLLEKIAKAGLPVIASTAGATEEDVDNVVSFFVHRNVELGLLHCVAEYPMKAENAHLNQIALFRDKYPNVVIGFSTHENPEVLETIPLAIGMGAKIFERHVAIRTEKYDINKYSSQPGDIGYWMDVAKEAFEICGDGKWRQASDVEKDELRALGRGVWAAKDIEEGELIVPENTLLAIPTQDSQVIANDLSKYVSLWAAKNLKKDDPILVWDVHVIDNRSKIQEIVRGVQHILKESNVLVPAQLDLEISHHYGLENFYKTGCVLINCINKSYCKKLIIVFPGQQHPEQKHELKDETFNLLWGDLMVKLDNRRFKCVPGDQVDVLPGTVHSFSSEKGAVIEEISSTHFSSDSYYLDETINKNKNRKTMVTDWLDI